MSDDRSMAPPGRLAMLEARVTELERRLYNLPPVYYAQAAPIRGVFVGDGGIPVPVGHE